MILHLLSHFHSGTLAANYSDDLVVGDELGSAYPFIMDYTASGNDLIKFIQLNGSMVLNVCQTQCSRLIECGHVKIYHGKR